MGAIAGKDFVDRTLEFFTNFYLQDDILTKVDRASMMVSLESRAVFLDNDLVDFCRRLPNRFKFRNGERKYLLKKVMARHLPARHFSRKKKGFGIPLAKWLRSLVPNGSAPVQGISAPVVERWWQEHRSARADHRLALFTSLSLQYSPSRRCARRATRSSLRWISPPLRWRRRPRRPTGGSWGVAASSQPNWSRPASSGPTACSTLARGTGANLRLLRDLGFTAVTGLDASEEAIGYCASKGLGVVRKGDICALPFADGSFDLVLATDVIEHVDDDDAAVREISRVLARGGKALITVPAFQSLWGLQDRKAFHKRRYRMKSLLALLRVARLSPDHCYHFNYLLFLPIYLARRVIDLLKIDLKSEGQVNNRLLNRILLTVFSLDISTAPTLKPPFGVSILVVAGKL